MIFSNLLRSINRKLLPMKAHYFLYNVGTGPVVPFLSTYARQLGFSSVVVGLIYTILPICGMITKPLTGAIADRFKCQKKIFLACIVITGAAFLAIYYSPKIPLEQKVLFTCKDDDAKFDTSPNNVTLDDCYVSELQHSKGTVSCKLNCKEYQAQIPLKFTASVEKSQVKKVGDVTNFYIASIEKEDGSIADPICPCGRNCQISTACGVDCSDYALNDALAVPSISDDDVYGQYQFWLFLIFMVIYWVSHGNVLGIGDAICFELLENQPHKYGYQRLYGSLGWGIFSVIAGFMVDSLNAGSAKFDYISAFYMAVAFLAVDFIAAFNIKYEQKKTPMNLVRDVGRLLKDVRVIIFLFWTCIVGMCTGVLWTYLFWIIEDLAKNQGCDSRGWVKTLEGLVMAVQCLAGELPFFFLSGVILKKIGHTKSMTVVLLAIGIKYILYSVIPNPWFFIPVELLHGLAFGLFYATMASYASMIAPRGTEATMQGLVGATFEGLGASLGSYAGGELFFKYGGPWTYRIFGIGALVFAFLHLGIQYFLRPQEVQQLVEDKQEEITSEQGAAS